MKFLMSVVCVLGVLVFVETQQMFEKIEEAFCKLQCINETVPLCYPKADCECSFNLIPDLDSINMAEYGKTELQLKCKTEDMFLVEWSNDFNPFDRSNNTAYFLHIKSSNDELFFSNVIFCHYYIAEGLTPNTSYSITLWGVDDGSNIFASKRLNVITNEMYKIPLPISNVSVELKPNAMQYEADVKWTPAEDLSCYYGIEIICMAFYVDSSTPTTETYDIVPSADMFTLHIGELHFGYTYDVIIRSRGTEWENESESRRYSIYVPTCIETHKNLTICEPPQPQNLTLMETPSSDKDESGRNIYDIQINWLKPSLIPDSYIAKLRIFDNKRQVTDTLNLTIPGEANSAIFKKVELSAYYQVHLQAISPGGRSVAAENHRFSILPIGVPHLEHEKTNSSKTLLIIPQTEIHQSQHKEMISLKTLLIVMGISGFLLVFGLSTILIRQKRLKRFNTEREDVVEKDYNQKQVLHTNLNEIVKETDEWEISIESLNFQNKLGEGAFGVVWHALIGQTPVACKTLKDNSTIDEIRQLQQEIEIMKYVGTHPNIVSMVGCITENVINGPILIVEYCSMGDLLTYLRTIYKHISNQFKQFQEADTQEGGNDFFNKSYELINQSETNLCLSYIDILSFGRQIAVGMEYLSNQRVLHRDLAARNILISDNKKVKVSDFGLSRDVYMNSVYCKTTGGKLPIRWMALESLTHQIYTSQSDVWSFGVLLWEIVSFGAIPYPEIESQELLGILKQGGRMTKPQICSDDLYSIMRDCWRESPKDRPTFSSLKEAFDALLTNETCYLELGSNL